MSLENIYYISQVVAVLIVIASLIAILYQSRQANKIAKAELTAEIWFKNGEFYASLYDSPEKAEFMHRGATSFATMTDAEKGRYFQNMGNAIYYQAGAFNLHKRGLMEDVAYTALESNVRRALEIAAVRRLWKISRKSGLDPEFVALLDGIVTEIENRQATESTQ